MVRPIRRVALAAVVESDHGVHDAGEAERRDHATGSTVVRITLYVKYHHLDVHGTVETLPVGQLDPRPVELGSAERVRLQVLDAIAGEPDLIRHAFEAQGLGAPDDGMPVEIDLQPQLQGLLPDSQPSVAGVTPPPRSVNLDPGDESDGG